MTWLFLTPLDARRFAGHDLGQAKTGQLVTEQTENRPHPAICVWSFYATTSGKSWSPNLKGARFFMIKLFILIPGVLFLRSVEIFIW